ncbi:hypothetical protein ABK040_002849 [Willaertia magna]
MANKKGSSLVNSGQQEDGLRQRKPTKNLPTLETETPSIEEVSGQATPKVVAPFLQEEFIDFLYKPHTMTILVATFAVIVYYSFLRYDSSFTTETNVKRGIWAMIALFLVYCATQFRDSILLRPHPAIWRVVTGIGIIYLLFLVFLMFQSKDDARSFMRFLDSSLGKSLPERDYASDCRVYTPDDPISNFRNIYDTVYDEFILAHILGYIGKALLFRDLKLCWVISITFELMEITFQHWLPNFAECWWDHIIIDVLICNNLGIIIGLYICEFLKMRKYPLWIGVTEIKSTKGKIKRILEQFTPFNWTNYDWHIFDDAKHFLYFVAIVLAMNLVELNAFFLKYVLWVPPPNLLNVYRLLVWFLLAMPAIREYYQFVSDPNTKRLGANTWIVIGIILAEFLVYFKFSEKYYEIEFPPHIWVNWVLFFAIFIPWFFTFFFFTSKATREKYPLVKFILNAMLTLSMVPMAFMFVSGCPDLQWGRQQFDTFIYSLLGQQPPQAAL